MLRGVKKVGDPHDIEHVPKNNSTSNEQTKE